VNRYINVGTVIQKEKFMYMNPRWYHLAMMITIVVVMMSQCTKIGEGFSPWPTIIKEVIKSGK